MKFGALPILVASLTLCENFQLNKAALILEQAKWKDPFIIDYKTRIELYLKIFFGLNSKSQVKEATRLVLSLLIQSIKDLSMIKTQIGRNYRKDPARKNVLLDILGYKKHWTRASKKNQTELIALLYVFANNLTVELRSELEGKNINAIRISNVLGFKDTLSGANITQETLKGSSKLSTEAAVKELTEIYDTAIDICLIGQKLFLSEKNRHDQFVFSKLIKQQGTDNQN